MRHENRPESWPAFARQMPLYVPESSVAPSSSEQSPSVASNGTHQSAKVDGRLPHLPHITEEDFPAPISAATEAGATVGASNSIPFSAPSAADGTVDHKPAFKDLMVSEWKEIVELIRQCWELELERRPNAASLQARASASVDSLYFHSFVGDCATVQARSGESSELTQG